MFERIEKFEWMCRLRVEGRRRWIVVVRWFSGKSCVGAPRLVYKINL